MKFNTVIQGPPFLNGSLHLGHGVNLLTKDFINRYRKEKDSELWFNWDAQGLPIEHYVKMKLAISEKEPIFLNECLKVTNKYFTEAQEVLKLLNLKGNDQHLKTTNKEYKVRLMNLLTQFYDSGKLVKRYEHVNYCDNCRSVLANAEIEEKQKLTKVYTYGARLISGIHKNKILLFATTFPHSISSNNGIAISKDATYYLHELENELLIVGSKIFRNNESKIEINYQELENSSYCLDIKNNPVEAKVLVSDIVQSNQKDNSNLKKKNDYLEQIAAVHLSSFHSYKDYLVLLNAGYVFDTFEVFKNRKIDMEPTDLKYYNQPLDIISTKKLCWKCKKDSDVNVTEQYFLVLTKEQRDSMVKQIEKVVLNNESLRSTLVSFFKAEVDWCISRDKLYGTPLPIVRCTNNYCKKEFSVNYEVSDFDSDETCFYSFLDPILEKKKILCSCGSKVEALKNSIDVWVDSAFLAEYFDSRYEMFLEGKDQIRGFFYCSSVLNTLLGKKIPFDKLLITGWIVDKKAQKLSKSSGNYSNLKEFLKLVDLRLLRSYILSKASSKDFEITPELVLNENKHFNTIKNVYKFIKSLTLEAKEVEIEDTLLNSYILEVDFMIQELETQVENLRFNLYWDKLKNFLLHRFSREIINSVKKQLNVQTVYFLKNYGFKLLELVKPVYGIENLEELLT